VPSGLVADQLYLLDGQALAAIGQCRLISLWDSLFGHLRQPIAQILLTRNDIADVWLHYLMIRVES
jgi:glutamate 5-kinase